MLKGMPDMALGTQKTIFQQYGWFFLIPNFTDDFCVQNSGNHSPYRSP
jgi:hypothetical protein